MHGIENVRSECSKFSLIFTCLWGNVILWSQGSCWSVCSSKDQTALLSRKAGRLWPERCSGLGARWRPWEEKCPVIYTSLLSLALQQPKPNPAGADRAPFSLSLTINFSCCFCFPLWHFSAPAGSQCRKLMLLRNQKRNQCWCNKLSQLSVGSGKREWMVRPQPPWLRLAGRLLPSPHPCSGNGLCSPGSERYRGGCLCFAHALLGFNKLSG